MSEEAKLADARNIGEEAAAYLLRVRSANVHAVIGTTRMLLRLATNSATRRLINESRSFG